MYDRTEMRESRRKRHRRKNSGGRLLAEYVGMILAVTAAILFLVQAVVINARIPSPSMEKTIMTGDQLFGNRLAYWRDGPKRYDIIIFYFPDDESQRFIKRVIGLPGETVEIRSGKVYIDGSDHPLRDDFCPEPPTGDFGPYHVPEDSYFVLGGQPGDIEGFQVLEEPVCEQRRDHRRGDVPVLAPVQDGNAEIVWHR